MSMSDFKLYFTNALVVMVTMSDIEVILKILLLIVTIGYTAFKWISIAKKYKDEQNK
jgi:hypothetical protein|tara:strand:+ start:1894 stop:2064 length:171 start_codon:yes stop_codon:yes gene_type:complete